MTQMKWRGARLRGALLRHVDIDEVEESMQGAVRPSPSKTVKRMKEEGDRSGLIALLMRLAARAAETFSEGNDAWRLFGTLPSPDHAGCGYISHCGPRCEFEKYPENPDLAVRLHRRSLIRWRRNVERSGQVALRSETATETEWVCGRLESAEVVRHTPTRLSGDAASGIVAMMMRSNGNQWFPLDGLADFLSWKPLTAFHPGSGNNPKNVYAHAALAWVNPELKRLWGRHSHKNYFSAALERVQWTCGLSYQASHLAGSIAWERATGALRIGPEHGTPRISKKNLARMAGFSHWGVKGIVHYVYTRYTHGAKWDWTAIGMWLRSPGWKVEVVSALDVRVDDQRKCLYMTWEAHHRRVPANAPEGLLSQNGGLTRADIQSLNLRVFNRLLKATVSGRHSDVERWIACMRISTLGQDATNLLDTVHRRGWVSEGEELWHALQFGEGMQWSDAKVRALLRWTKDVSCTGIEDLMQLIRQWEERFENMTFTKALRVLELREKLAVLNVRTTVEYALHVAGVPDYNRLFYEINVEKVTRTYSAIPAPTSPAMGDYVVQRLEDGDVLGPLLGFDNISYCCQHPWGAASSSAWHGHRSSNGGFWVLANVKTGQIVAQSHVWREGDVLVLDSLEARRENAELVAKVGPELYKAAAKSVIGRLGIRAVHGGNRFGDLWEAPVVTPVRCAEPHYNADSITQYLLACGDGSEVPAPGSPNVRSTHQEFLKLLAEIHKLEKELES